MFLLANPPATSPSTSIIINDSVNFGDFHFLNTKQNLKATLISSSIKALFTRTVTIFLWAAPLIF